METKSNSIINKIVNSHKLRFGFIIVCVIILAVIFVNTDKGYSDDSENLIVQGNLKTNEIDLNSKLAGKIEKISVKEGDIVKAGDVIVTISSESISAKKLQAEAAYAAAQAQYDKALNGARSQDVAQAKAAYDLASKTYARLEALYKEGAVAESAYDQAYAQYQAAKETYDMSQQGTREEDKIAAEALVAQAKAAIEEVQTYLDDSVITAPNDGRVISLNVKKGELISTGMPLATIETDEKPWVELNVRETELSQVHMGEKVSVEFLTYPDEKFEGTVVKISQNPDFATKRATNNNGEFDILSFGVRVELSDINQELYPGMTVIIDFGKKAVNK